MTLPPSSGTQQALAEVLPAEILGAFDDRFIRSCELVEEYVHRLHLRFAAQSERSRATAPRQVSAAPAASNSPLRG